MFQKTVESTTEILISTTETVLETAFTYNDSETIKNIVIYSSYILKKLVKGNF
jgi:hypothetical protein